MIKRIALLFGYWIAGFGVAYMFSGFGELSQAPFLILVSWPGFVIKLLSQLGNPAEAGPFSNDLTSFLSLFVLYYVGLIALTSKLSTRWKKGSFLVPCVIHLCGGLAFILTSDNRGILPPGILDGQGLDWQAPWYLASYIISFAITLLWFYLDWRLAKKISQRKGIDK